MIKVAFVSWHYQNTSVFLETIRKMTPGNSGKWKNIEAVLDPNQADFVAVFDGANQPVPADRSIYFGQHPTGLSSYRDWSEVPALLKLTLDKHWNPGEWWIDHTYDELMALECPVKTKDVVCVCTGHTHTEMYRKRLEFLEAYCSKYSDMHLYGRPIENYFERKILLPFYKGVLGHRYPDGTKGEHLTGKEDVLLDHRYSVEFDVGPTVNYISERFYDALLLWAMPIYFGSTNVHKLMPSNCFQYIDTSNLEDIKVVNDVVNSSYREDNISTIAEARQLLLNKYQTWPYVHDVVNNIDKYRKINIAGIAV